MMRQWIALLAVQFTIGVGVGRAWEAWRRRPKQTKQDPSREGGRDHV